MSRIYYLQNRSSLGGFRQNYDRCYSDLDNTFILHPCRQYCLPKFIVNWFWCSCIIKFGNSALSDKLPMWAPSITTSSYSKTGFLFFSPWMSPSMQNVSFYLKSLWVSAFPCLLTCMPSTLHVDMQWLFEVISLCLSKCTCTVGANPASVQHLRVKGKYQEQALGPCCSCLTKLLVPSYLFCSKCTLFLCLFTPVSLPCRPHKNLMHKSSASPQKHR